LFLSFEFGSLGIVYDFEFRTSDLSNYDLRHCQIYKTWPKGPGFKNETKATQSWANAVAE